MIGFFLVINMEVMIQFLYFDNSSRESMSNLGDVRLE